MCIRKSVSSQLTGVSESPEETAAQPCRVSAGFFREPCTHSDEPVLCSLKLQAKAGPGEAESRVFVGWPPWRHGHPPSFCVGLSTFSTHTHTSRCICWPTVSTWFYFYFQSGSSSSAFLKSTLLMAFSLSTDRFKRGLNMKVFIKARSFPKHMFN